MLHALTRLLPTLPLLVVLGQTPAPDEALRFAPEQGSTQGKRLTWGSTIEIEEFELDLEGQLFDLGEGLEREIEHVLAVQDTYAAVAVGRPRDLQRHYVEVVRTVAANESEVAELVQVNGLGRRASVLQGHRVRFRWDEEAEAYDRTWAEDDRGGVEDAWLDGLEEDLDLRALLPAKAVEVGDTWELERDVALALLRPGGDLLLEVDAREEQGTDDGVRLDVPSIPLGAYLNDLDGRVTCQLLSIEEVSGLREAILRVRVEVESVQDLADALADDDPDGQLYDVVEQTLQVFGEGELRWSLDADRAVGFEFEAEVERALDAEWTLEIGGRESSVSVVSRDRGRAWLRYELE